MPHGQQQSQFCWLHTETVPSQSGDGWKRPLGRFFSVSVANRTCLANFSWDILDTWPNQLSWDLPILRSGSTFKPDFANFTAAHFVTKCHIVCSSKNTHLCYMFLKQHSFSHYPRFMDIGENRNKDRFKNWQLCGVRKLPFCDHRAIKLTQNCVCFTNPCTNLLIPPSSTREYHPEVLELLHLLQCIATHVQRIHHLGFLEGNDTSVFWVLIFVSVWLHAAENWSSACWRPCREDESSTKSFAKSKRLILQLQTVTPSSTRLLLSMQFISTTKYVLS